MQLVKTAMMKTQFEEMVFMLSAWEEDSSSINLHQPIPYVLLSVFVTIPWHADFSGGLWWHLADSRNKKQLYTQNPKPIKTYIALLTADNDVRLASHALLSTQA